jgi:polar amino acid transport system substrate-binding protein
MAIALITTLALGGCSSTAGDSGSGSGSDKADSSAPKVSVPLPAAVKQRGEFIVGVHCTNPPAGYVGVDGQHDGYEIDIVKQLAAIAFGDSSKLEMQCTTEANRISFLSSGKIDFLLASLAYSADRAKQIDYSEPVWLSNLQLLVPKNSPITGFDDIAGKTVITPTGSTYVTWLQKCHPDAKIDQASDAAAGTTALTQQRGDAFGYIDVYDWNFANKNSGYKVVGNLEAPAVQGAAVKKGNKEMLTWLNAALEKLRMEDFFFKSFSKEVNDPTFSEKYRDVVPGPDKKLDYSNANQFVCD